MRGHYTDVWQAVAEALPDRPALRTPDGDEWSYRRFADEAAALAATLRERGLGRGDRVAMLLYNRPEFLITLFATLAAGMTPVPLNYRFRAGEVADLLVDSRAVALVHPTSLAEVVAGAVAGLDDPPHLFTVDDDGSDAPGTPWSEAVATPATLPSTPPPDGELWLYTGGTTGRPRAVRWGAEDMLEVQMLPAYAPLGIPYPRDAAEAARIASAASTPHVVTLPLAPFMHGTALTVSMNTLLVGGTVLATCSPRLDPEAAVRFALDAGATRFIVAGDAVTIPIVEAAERMGVRLDGVDSVFSSGMRFSPETKRRLHALGDLQIVDLLASSEGGAFAVTTTTGEHDLPGRPRLTPNAVVLDDRQNEVQDRVGALGLLGAHGALPKGYHGDEEKTKAAFPVIRGRRHVVPGDWVRVEEDGHIELLGRGSAVVNTGGEKVYPLEVEEALISHPAVSDVVVLGAPDPRFGEVVAAVVAADEGAVTVDELLAHVEPLIAGYKKPRHILIRPSLERTPHGKVDLGRWRDEIVRDRERTGVTA